MNSPYLRFALFSVLFVALQVWVLSPIALFRVATPYLYPFLLLLLPVGTSRSVLCVVGFVLGFLIDFFGLTPGLHASALTLTAFLRQPILYLLTEKNTPEHLLPLFPTLRGGSVMLITLLLLVHHVTLYILQAAGMRMGALHIIISFASGYAFSWVLSVMTLFFFGTGEGARSK